MAEAESLALLQIPFNPHRFVATEQQKWLPCPLSLQSSLVLFTQSGKKQAATGFPASQETPTTVHLSVKSRVNQAAEEACHRRGCVAMALKIFGLVIGLSDSQVPPYLEVSSGAPQYPMVTTGSRQSRLSRS